MLAGLPAEAAVLGTTATANDRVVTDVVAQLAGSGPDGEGGELRTYRGSLARTSLRMETVELPHPAERLAWLTDFTGSAGLAVVLATTAAVFTDGRYVLQLAQQTDARLWQRLHITEQPPHLWLAEHAPKGGRFGYDPLLYLPDLYRTSAELSPAEKNARSHRGEAARALARFLAESPLRGES